MAKKFKVKKSFTPWGRFIRGICRVVKKKPALINLNDTGVPPCSIMIGNHNGAGGPFNFRTFLHTYCMTWGAHQMTEGFLSRYRYLNKIFYRRKLGYGPIKSFLFSIGFGIFSPLPYSVAGTIPVYYDNRVYKTFDYSMQCLQQNVPVMVFPEDSDAGYQEIIDRFHGGFLMLSKMYYRKHGVDLPIYTPRFNTKPKQIVIGKPMYYNEMAKTKTDQEILDIFRNYMNDLKDTI